MLHFEAIGVVDVQIGAVAFAVDAADAINASANRVGVGAAAAGAQTAPIAAITASVIYRKKEKE